MKFLGIFLIAFGFTQCKTIKFDKTPPFAITKATYVNWVGGQPGVSGIRVEITFKTNPKVTFDSLYYKNKSVKLQRRQNERLLTGNFNTSNVNNGKNLILHRDVKKEVGNQLPEVKSFPFELKGNEAVISYQVNGKTKYYKISELKKGKPILYQ